MIKLYYVRKVKSLRNVNNLIKLDSGTHFTSAVKNAMFSHLQ
jgi:hypothetical protein